jgi:hypothetical protein
MIKELLNRNKTQTRRIIKLQPILDIRVPEGSKVKEGLWIWPKNINWWVNNSPDESGILDYCPYGQVGARLWARETFATEKCWDNKPMSFFNNASDVPIWYKVCDPLVSDFVPCGKWRPSIFMPRWASRITLEITDIRVQRLQDILEDDAAAEGIRYAENSYELEWMTPSERGRKRIKDYQILWDSINGKKYSWESNPFVWALSFKVINQSKF